MPALILEVPSQRIVAANPSAQEMLAAGDDIVGHNLEEFAADEPTGALELLVAGKLNGYEARRTLKRASGGAEPMRVWVRQLGSAQPPQFAIAVLNEQGHPGSAPAPPATSDELSAVAGTTDGSLYINGVSADIVGLLGYQPADVIGRSLFTLFDPDDRPSLLWALAQAATGRTGVTLWMRARRSGGGGVPCQLLIIPLLPLTTFGFALLPSEEQLAPLANSGDMRDLVWRLGRGAAAVTAARGASASSLADPEILAKLTSRELEIVVMLLSGDRVPEIARTLYLAPGTVRNHLSSVFRRLGVASQQELISMLRKKPPRSAAE
jgi:DNA-binding CsgD family transcriptional regulator